MTNTTAATYTIPTQGLTHTAADGAVITATHRPTGGYLVQIRDTDGELGGKFHTFETDAIDHYNRLVETRATPIEPAPAVVLAPAAKGTATNVSDPQHTVLAVAALNGWVARGGQVGQASVTTLTALARRGYLALTYQTGRTDRRKVVTGATITQAGRIRLNQLTAADAAEYERARRIAAILNASHAAA